MADPCHICGFSLDECGSSICSAAHRIWTDDEVASMNAYQQAGIMHPFTCGHKNHSVELVATPHGWVCPITGIIEQRWAHKFMTDWSWQRSGSPLGGRHGKKNEH